MADGDTRLVDLAGKALPPAYLYRVLMHGVYRGDAVHKGKPYPGEHQAIIDAQPWDQDGRISSRRGSCGQRRAGMVNALLTLH